MIRIFTIYPCDFAAPTLYYQTYVIFHVCHATAKNAVQQRNQMANVSFVVCALVFLFYLDASFSSCAMTALLRNNAIVHIFFCQRSNILRFAWLSSIMNCGLVISKFLYNNNKQTRRILTFYIYSLIFIE